METETENKSAKVTFELRPVGVAALAKELNYSKGTLSSVMRGKETASKRLQEQLEARGYKFDARGFFIPPKGVGNAEC